jgi:arabinose-5-phosphate isomerase
LEITEKKLGMTAIVDDDNRLVGIFTDGDLRRMLAKNLDVRTTCIVEVMTPNCTVIKTGALAAEAMQIMERKKINALIVVDDQHRALGALNMHDLIRAGIV